MPRFSGKSGLHLSTIRAVGIDICIRGSGLVAQTLALLLARQRIRVAMVQTTAPSNHTDIRSFALNAFSRSILSQLRIWSAGAASDFIAQPVRGMRIYGQGAAPLCFDAPPGEDGALAWIVDAQALQARLSQAISFAPEISLLQHGEPAALTVICEGSASQTRRELGVEFEQFDYGQTAIAAQLEERLAHEGLARQWMHSGEVCAFLPRAAQANSAATGGALSLVWSVSHERAKQLLAMDDHAFCEQLCQFSALPMDSLRLSSQRLAWPLKIAQAKRWCGTLNSEDPTKNLAWALAGDAAHTVHPLAGQGLNLGLADTHQLASIFENKAYFRSFADMRLLREYERSRKVHCAKLRLATDGLAQLFLSPDTRLTTWRDFGLRNFNQLDRLKAFAMRQAAGAANGMSYTEPH